jgi:hypothetical protein
LTHDAIAADHWLLDDHLADHAAVVVVAVSGLSPPALYAPQQLDHPCRHEFSFRDDSSGPHGGDEAHAHHLYGIETRQKRWRFSNTVRRIK